MGLSPQFVSFSFVQSLWHGKIGEDEVNKEVCLLVELLPIVFSVLDLDNFSLFEKIFQGFTVSKGINC